MRCSGKIYYDLLEAREKFKNSYVVFIRIEQLYPFPYDELEDAIKKYPNVSEFIWAQEEPANQGAWFSHRHRIQRVLDRLKKNFVIDLRSRPAAAAPAVGLNKLHVKQQQELVNQVFSVSEKIK